MWTIPEPTSRVRRPARRALGIPLLLGWLSAPACTTGPSADSPGDDAPLDARPLPDAMTAAPDLADSSGAAPDASAEDASDATAPDAPVVAVDATDARRGDGDLPAADEPDTSMACSSDLGCPEDDLGTACVEGRCRTACERAAIEGDYAGCVFWAVDLDNIVDPFGAGPGAEGVAVVLSNVSPHPADVEIRSEPEHIVHAETLAAGAVRTFELFARDQVGTRLQASAYRVTATVPVLAYQFNPLNRAETSSTDASLLLPEAALGQRYRILSFPAQGTNQRGFVTLVGVGEGPTTVSLTVSGQTIEGVDYRDDALPLEGHVIPALAPGQTVARTLSPFDVLQLESSRDSDLSGTLVRSDGPVAVFAGTRCSNVPAGVPSCDHLEHQMIPVATWAQTIVAPPGPRREAESTIFRVVADFASTFVETEPAVAGTPTTLGPGGVLTFEVSEPTTIRATEPVMVGQYLASAEAGAGGFGDPSFTILPPVEQFRTAYTFLVPDSYEADTVTLFRNRVSGPATPVIALDDVDLEAALPDLFAPIGDSGYELGYIEVGDGPHSLVSDSPFGVLVSGFDWDVSYAYPGGLQLFKRGGSVSDDTTGQCGDGGWLGSVCDTGSPGRCALGRTLCGPDSICVPVLAAASELCNGVDDDCDGPVDEEPACSDGLELFFVSPGPPLVELVEGDTAEFRVALAYSGSAPLEIAWFIDSPDEPVAFGDALSWRVLPFEAGVHHVWVVASAGLERESYEWLVHVHDVPTNFPALYGQAVGLDGAIARNVPITVVLPGTTDEPIPGGKSYTDFRGFYALTLAAGSYRLMIDNYDRAMLDFPPGRRLLEWAVLSETDSRRDVVSPAARMWGIVYAPDADGTPVPIANARLTTYPTSSSVCTSCWQQTVTDEAGRYQVELFAGRHRVDVTALGLPDRQVELDVAGDLRRDFYLDSAPPPGETHEIQLTVTEPCTGGPVAGVQLYVRGGGYTAYPYSDADGHVSVSLPPGPYEFFSYRHTGASPPVGPGIVLLDILTVPDDDGAVLEIPNAYVSGRVHNESDGLGVANVRLALRGNCSGCIDTRWTSTEPPDEGEYGLYVLAANYTIVVTPPAESGWANFTTPTHPVESCSESLDIGLRDPIHRIQGTVTALVRDADGALVSRPVDHLAIQLRGPSWVDADTDEAGRFDFLAVPGDYQIRVEGPRYASSLWGVLPGGRFAFWHSGDELAGSDPEAPVHLDLDPLPLPMTFVSGTVSNIEGGGLGLEGASLRFIHQHSYCDSGCERSAVTDADGYYEVGLFRPIYDGAGAYSGLYRIEIDPGEFFPPQILDGVLLEEPEARIDIAVEE